MALTKQEWNHAAEKAAAEKYGRDHAGGYTFKRYGAAPTFVLLAAGVLGFLGYKAWTKAAAFVTGASLDIPRWSMMAAAILIVATIIAYRPGRQLSATLTLPIIKAFVFVVLWLGLAMMTLGAI